MTIYYHKLFILSIHYDKYFHKVIIFYHACVYPCRDGAAEARKDVLRVTFTSGNAAGVRRCADNFTVGAENKLARRSGAQKLFACGKRAGCAMVKILFRQTRYSAGQRKYDSARLCDISAWEKQHTRTSVNALGAGYYGGVIAIEQAQNRRYKHRIKNISKLTGRGAIPGWKQQHTRAAGKSTRRAIFYGGVIEQKQSGR